MSLKKLISETIGCFVVLSICALLGMLLGANAHADDREWRTEDTVREVVWQAINLADMGTTLDIAKQNEAAGYAKYREINPLIGHNPSPERVTERMLLGAVAHAAVSYALPHKWREAWQYVTIGTSGLCVQNNLEIGLRVNF